MVLRQCKEKTWKLSRVLAQGWKLKEDKMGNWGWKNDQEIRWNDDEMFSRNKWSNKWVDK